VGAILAGPLFRHVLWRIGLAALAATACLFAAGIALAALRQLTAGRAVRWTVVMASLYLATVFPASLTSQEPTRFGHVRLPLRGAFEETYARRPRITYRLGPLGFREPPFAERKAEGTLRIALIGDSYVFGSGVTVEGTLSSQLAAQLRESYPKLPIEVLNLGVPGHNLTSHVDLYAAAVERLAPDVVVLCLTLPNDLGSWDLQNELRDSSRPSFYSAGRFLLGRTGAQVLWDMALLQASVTPSCLAHLRSELARLSELRARGGPPLLVLTYQIPEPAITAELTKLAAVPLVLCPGDHVKDFIPGDGHPTASGNARFAALLARQMAESVLIVPATPPLPAAR
jgi:lysophospholipase L1-like esterase